MNKQLYGMLIVGMSWALPVYAVEEAGLQCTLIRDNALRLACFDKIYGAQFPPLRLPVPPENTQPKMPVDLVRSVSSSMENKEATVVFSPAEQTTETRYEPTQALLDAADAYTPLSRMYDLDENSVSVFTLREHHPMYLIPAWYNSSPNYVPQSPSRGSTNAEKFSEQKRLEAKMQVSFKTKLMEDLFKTRADVWFGYTQKSDWQVWNQGNRSAPFRNSSYSPEVFITQPVKADLPAGGKLRMLGAGFIHESNGQSRPESRSWNRLYGMAGMEWGKLTVLPRVWIRAFDGRSDDDDNPDIMDYMGYGDVKLQYRLNDKRTVSTTMRWNPKTGKGAVEADYTFPLRGKMKAYVRGFHGYGESLIDYNHKQTGVGVGVMFNDWDGF